MATRNKRRRLEPANVPAPDDADQAGELGVDLALTRPQEMSTVVADRYAAIGAQWLADPLPTRLDHALIERLAGQGFRREHLADIRVHRGTRAHAAADALDARAFAVGGGDVFFAPGQYDPSTPEGRAVIAHEVAHVAPPISPPAGVHSGGAPLWNEPRRRDGDQHSEAEERRARQAEAFVFAQERQGSAPAMAQTSISPATQAARLEKQHRLDPRALEDKVMAILKRQLQADRERSGQF